MLVQELNKNNFKKIFADYFTDEGAEMLYSYLAEIFTDEEKLRVIDEAAIKDEFDFILHEDMYKYDEEELNIVDVGITGVLVEW